MRLETVTVALRGVTANKLRSSLTILGLTIGVASVIVLIAVGNGSSQAVQKRIEALGSNVLLVTRGGRSVARARATRRRSRSPRPTRPRSTTTRARRRGECVARGERQRHARATAA